MPRAHFIVQVGAERAVFDQGVAAGGVPLVVDVDRPAGIAERAIVHDCDERTGNGLADAPRVVAGALAVEVRLQAVAHRLVQQNAAISCRQHNRQGARWRFDRILLEDGHAGRLAGGLLGCDAGEVVDTEPPAAARTRHLAAVSPERERADVETNERLHVADHPAVTSRHEDVLQFVADTRVHARDAGVEGPRGTVGALKEGYFLGCGGGAQGLVTGVVGHAGHLGSGVHRGRAFVPAADARRGFRCLAHLLQVQGFRVGVADRVALHDADADALGNVARGRLDALLLPGDRAVGAVFEKKFGEVSAAAQRR